MLVAISIPIFTAQLEKSRDSADQANIRSAYAELSAALVSNTKSNATISDLGLDSPWSGEPLAGDTAATITYTYSGKGSNTTWDNTGTDFKIGNIQVVAVADANTITFTVQSGEIKTIVLSKTTS